MDKRQEYVPVQHRPGIVEYASKILQESQDPLSRTVEPSDPRAVKYVGPKYGTLRERAKMRKRTSRRRQEYNIAKYWRELAENQQKWREHLANKQISEK